MSNDPIRDIMMELGLRAAMQHIEEMESKLHASEILIVTLMQRLGLQSTVVTQDEWKAVCAPWDALALTGGGDEPLTAALEPAASLDHPGRSGDRLDA